MTSTSRSKTKAKAAPSPNEKPEWAQVPPSSKDGDLLDVGGWRGIVRRHEDGTLHIDISPWRTWRYNLDHMLSLLENTAEQVLKESGRPEDKKILEAIGDLREKVTKVDPKKLADMGDNSVSAALLGVTTGVLAYGVMKVLRKLARRGKSSELERWAALIDEDEASDRTQPIVL